MQITGRWVAAAAVAAVALGATAQAVAQAEEEQALEAVRSRIQALEQRRDRERTQRDEVVSALERAEREIAAAEQELERLRRRSREQAAQREALQARSAEERGRLAAEREALARELRVAYMTGRAELPKLLLSQESPATLGRMMVYYDYLARARGERIAAVGERLVALARLAEETERVARELEAVERARAARLQTLTAARAERREAIARLESSIADAGGEIERLRDEEQRLVELVLELGEALAAFPVNVDEPFAGLKGRLAWPVNGELMGNFGTPRQGGPLRWNGVLVRAGGGAPVRAVYHGRVAFADWLAGLGLLVIIDHGDGYMSLYGHNEALLKEAGDWVSPGEVIARAGDTGGLAHSSLYFEIRENGVPVDPHAWMGQPLAASR